MSDFLESLTPSQREMLEAAKIPLPAPLPLFDSPPNQSAMTEWIACQPSLELQTYAKKLAENLNYISMAEFLTQLRLTIAEFNQYHTEPYVLCIAQRGEDYTHKSEPWVIALALQYANLRLPEAILTTSKVKAYIKDNPNIKTVLMLDDASYSGAHISTEILFLSAPDEVLDLSLILGIPFLTHFAMQFIREPRNVKQITFLAHQTIPTIGEVLSASELGRLQTIMYDPTTEEYDGPDPAFVEAPELARKSLTYFSHKYPDFMSNLQMFVTGGSLAQEWLYQKQIKPFCNDCIPEKSEAYVLDQHIPKSSAIVPYIPSPYAYHRFSLGSPNCNVTKLLDAIRAGNVGRRTDQPLPAFLERAYPVAHPLPARPTRRSCNRAERYTAKAYRQFIVKTWLADETSFQSLVSEVSSKSLPAWYPIRLLMRQGQVTALSRLLRTPTLTSIHLWEDALSLYDMLSSASEITAYGSDEADDHEPYNCIGLFLNAPFWQTQETDLIRQAIKRRVFTIILYNAPQTTLKCILPFITAEDLSQPEYGLTKDGTFGKEIVSQSYPDPDCPLLQDILQPREVVKTTNSIDGQPKLPILPEQASTSGMTEMPTAQVNDYHPGCEILVSSLVRGLLALTGIGLIVAAGILLSTTTLSPAGLVTLGIGMACTSIGTYGFFSANNTSSDTLLSRRACGLF